MDTYIPEQISYDNFLSHHASLIDIFTIKTGSDLRNDTESNKATIKGALKSRKREMRWKLKWELLSPIKGGIRLFI